MMDIFGIVCTKSFWSSTYHNIVAYSSLDFLDFRLS